MLAKVARRIQGRPRARPHQQFLRSTGKKRGSRKRSPPSTARERAGTTLDHILGRGGGYLRHALPDDMVVLTHDRKGTALADRALERIREEAGSDRRVVERGEDPEGVPHCPETSSRSCGFTFRWQLNPTVRTGYATYESEAGRRVPSKFCGRFETRYAAAGTSRCRTPSNASTDPPRVGELLLHGNSLESREFDVVRRRRTQDQAVAVKKLKRRGPG